MNVLIHTNEKASNQQRQEWESIVRIGLTRFATRLVRVSISVTDENGPRGGNDKRCVTLVRPRGLKQIVVQETSDSIEKAIRLGVERASHTLTRLVERKFRGLKPRNRDFAWDIE